MSLASSLPSLRVEPHHLITRIGCAVEPSKIQEDSSVPADVCCCLIRLCRPGAGGWQGRQGCGQPAGPLPGVCRALQYASHAIWHTTMLSQLRLPCEWGSVVQAGDPVAMQCCPTLRCWVAAQAGSSGYAFWLHCCRSEHCPAGLTQ